MACRLKRSSKMPRSMNRDDVIIRKQYFDITFQGIHTAKVLWLITKNTFHWGGKNWNNWKTDIQKMLSFQGDAFLPYRFPIFHFYLRQQIASKRSLLRATYYIMEVATLVTRSVKHVATLSVRTITEGLRGLTQENIQVPSTETVTWEPLGAIIFFPLFFELLLTSSDLHKAIFWSRCLLKKVFYSYWFVHHFVIL